MGKLNLQKKKIKSNFFKVWNKVNMLIWNKSVWL